MSQYKHQCKRRKRSIKPLDSAALRDLALAYVARYATSSAKLERYLARKLRERGWSENEQAGADIPALVSHYVELGYVDDEAFARNKSASLLRRGYGKRRVNQALGQDGISSEIREDVAPEEAEQRQAALALMRKRRFGPYALSASDGSELDRSIREKQIAAMLRAGHDLDIVRNLMKSDSVEEAEEWAAELDDDNSEEGQSW